MKSYQCLKCSLQDLKEVIGKNISQQLSSFDNVVLCYQGILSSSDGNMVECQAIVLQDHALHFGAYNLERGYLGDSILLSLIQQIDRQKVDFGTSLSFHEVEDDHLNVGSRSFVFTQEADADAFEKKVVELIDAIA